MVELYTDFFRFTERPFTLLPDPDFLYWSSQHKRAYAVLEYSVVTQAALTVITGEVGAGKTTLVQKLLASTDLDVTIGLISNATGGRGDLLRWVLSSLNINAHPDEDYITLFNRFQDFVISEYAKGGNVVLIIDEAQNLSVEELEELRMFTNINSNKYLVLQLVLIGQPELRDTIASPQLQQFAQRVAVSYHLKPLDEVATEDYIRHRLQHVGGRGDEFTADAMRAVFAETDGVPRLINKVCDLALVYASAAERKSVDAAIIGELIDDGVFIKARKAEVYVLSEHEKLVE